MSRRLLTLTAALVLAAPAAQAGAATGAAGHVRYAIDRSRDLSQVSRTARRHGVIILKSSDVKLMRRLKSANRNLIALVYKNLSFTSAARSWSRPGTSPAGVPYPSARKHSSWFLRNRRGRRIVSRAYPYLLAMDIGRRAYQRALATGLVREIRARGWDGVFLDDVNPTIKTHYRVSSVARYRTDSAYSRATRSALAYLAPRLRRAGKLAFANIGHWAEYPSTGLGWLRYLDGAMQEHFAKSGSSPGSGYYWDWGPGGWQTQLDLVRGTEAQGKRFLGIAHSKASDAAAARYGWATVLLAAQGRSYFALAQDYGRETWFSEYDYDIGEPAGEESREESGVHRRPFSNGLVLVNPTSAERQVELGGSYSGSGLHQARSATMPPNSGLVLYRDEPMVSPPGPLPLPERAQ